MDNDEGSGWYFIITAGCKMRQTPMQPTFNATEMTINNGV